MHCNPDKHCRRRVSTAISVNLCYTEGDGAPSVGGAIEKIPVKRLNDRQRRILGCIKAYQRRHGYPPTRLELAHEAGFGEASSIARHLAALAKAGWIQLQPNTKRGIRVLDDIPVIGPIGQVAIGTPILSDAHIVRRLPAAVADCFRPRPDYLLTVRGDGMSRTGLQDGDVVAIHRTEAPASGQVVVARYGDEVTLKRYVKLDERHVELRPESHNPDHEVMQLDLAKHRLEIDGVAVGAVITRLRDTEPETGHLFAE